MTSEEGAVSSPRQALIPSMLRRSRETKEYNKKRRLVESRKLAFNPLSFLRFSLWTTFQYREADPAAFGGRIQSHPHRAFRPQEALPVTPCGKLVRRAEFPYRNDSTELLISVYEISVTLAAWSSIFRIE